MAGVRAQSYCIVHPDSEFEDPKFSFGDTHISLELPSGDAHGGSQDVESTPASSSWQRPKSTTAFDRVFAPKTSQEKIFQVIAKTPVLEALDNFMSATFIAVGASGGGKTFAVTGGAKRFADRGLIPRSISALFEALCSRSDRDDLEVAVSFYELYKDGIVDLLSDKRRRVALHQGEAGPTLAGLIRQAVATESDAYHLLFQGDSNRHFERLPLNTETSRGHVFYVLHLTHRQTGSAAVLSFVDLAAVVSTRNQATAAIAQSIGALRSVVTAINANMEPAWDASSLTQLLQPCMQTREGSQSAYLALISPMRYMGQLHREYHEWLTFSQLFMDALRVSGSRSAELETQAEPSRWPPRQPADEATNAFVQRTTVQQNDEIKRDSVATMPGKTHVPGSTKTTNLMGSSSSAKALSVASLPEKREFNGQCSNLVLPLPGLQSPAQVPMEILDGNGQRSAASLVALPGRGFSASPSVGKLEGAGVDTQHSPEANGVSTNATGGLSAATLGNARAQGCGGVSSYAAPAAWVARPQFHGPAASVAGPAASPAATVQRPLSPQGRVNSITRYTHQSADASGVVNSRNNSRSPSPLGNRTKVDPRMVTRTNIYAQHVGLSMSPPPAMGGSVPQPLGISAPSPAPLSRPVSPMGQTRVLSVPQAWSPQHSRAASPQPGAPVHVQGAVQNSRGVLRSVSPVPAMAGVASASVNRFPYAWSSPMRQTNGYPMVASPCYGATSVNSRSGSVSPMRGAHVVANPQVDNAPTPLRAHGLAAVSREVQPTNNGGSDVGGLARVPMPWASSGAGGGSLRR